MLLSEDNFTTAAVSGKGRSQATIVLWKRNSFPAYDQS